MAIAGLRTTGRWTLAGAALAVPLIVGTPAQAEILRARDLARGVSMTPAQCAAQPLAVWIAVGNRQFCIRYYISTAGGEGAVPVVWLSGDKLGTVDMRTRQIKVKSDEKDIDTDKLQHQADTISKLARTTAIYLARPGLDGSSGHHAYRRSWLELYAVSAAMDAIRRRHGFRGFHVAGQSGGAGLIGGLMAIRQDLVCVVPGAGRLALLKPARPERDRLLQFFDASQAIPTIVRNRHMRILVVTDPRDQRVKAEHQVGFVRALLAAGGRIDQFYVHATDENHHGVAVYTRFVVAACVRGLSNQEIVAGLAGVQERHLAAASGRGGRQASSGSRQRRQHHAGRGGSAPQPYQTQSAPASAPPPAPQQQAGGSPQQPRQQQFTRPVPPPDSPYYRGPRQQQTQRTPAPVAN